MYQQTRALSGGGFSCYIFFSINIAGAAEKCLGEKGKIFFFKKRGLRWVVSRVSQQQLKKKRGKSTHCANNKKVTLFCNASHHSRSTAAMGKKCHILQVLHLKWERTGRGRRVGWMGGGRGKRDNIGETLRYSWGNSSATAKGFQPISLFFWLDWHYHNISFVTSQANC